MATLQLLQDSLQANLPWNRARIKLLARLLVALVQVKTVNLAPLASVLQTDALSDSNYKRLQRFFRDFAWHVAGVELNVLVLGIAHRGTAMPILWRVLPKAGCTSFAERRDIVEDFIAWFGSDSIAYVTADREFHGRRFYSYLGERGIAFCLRARMDTPMRTAFGKVLKMRRVLCLQPLGVKRYWSGKRRLWGQEVKVATLRLYADEWLIVVGSDGIGDLFAAYAVRWEIETLFGCLKSRGFCLEDSRLTRPERLQALVGVLALCFCWALKVGEWISAQRPLKAKTHKRLAKSIFRTGLDSLRQVVCRFQARHPLLSWRKAVRFLSCT